MIGPMGSRNVSAVTLWIGGSAIASAASSLTALVAMPENDLIRALAVIGVIAAGLAALYLLVDHRTRDLRNLNTTIAKVARNENDLITFMRNGNPLDSGDMRRRN
jgi:hypothetical protein